MDDIEKKVADYRKTLQISIAEMADSEIRAFADLECRQETAVQLYRLGLLLEKVIERLADKA